MKTLVYHAGALGDFVTILPTLDAWRREHPGSHLSLLGSKAFGDVGMLAGLFDQAFDV